MSVCSWHNNILFLPFYGQKSQYRPIFRPIFRLHPYLINNLAWSDPDMSLFNKLIYFEYFAGILSLKTHYMASLFTQGHMNPIQMSLKSITCFVFCVIAVSPLSCFMCVVLIQYKTISYWIKQLFL